MLDLFGGGCTCGGSLQLLAFVMILLQHGWGWSGRRNCYNKQSIENRCMHFYMYMYSICMDILYDVLYPGYMNMQHANVLIFLHVAA